MKPTPILLGLLSVQLTGCGFIISKGPPTGHEQMLSFSCTESNAGPILDIVWASLNVLGAVAAASDRSAYENPDQIVAVGLGWGVVSSFSAASGFKKSKECRRALQQLAERNAQLRSNPTGLVIPTDVVQSVVVSPSESTLAVGDRQQLVASAHSSSGTVIPNRDFTWSSSNDAIASVSNAGLVTAHAAGTVVIAANSGNVVGTARIVVTAPR
ncbi:MAG TPA: Ig-like domain-containing protein [Gemmatimonadales bacterium]|nr:Ig-like domain-containing protein [Gemmatimonadales bacterium]